jgi:hypothetical protein
VTRAEYVRAGSVALALILAASLLAPATASASIIPDINLPNLDPSHFIVDGFKALLKFIFGDQLDELGHNLLGLLLAVPILTDTHAFKGLNDYRTYVQGGAFGVLGLSFVVASLRYWLSSYSGSGTYEALQGFARTGGAIAMLLMFVPAFDQVCRAVNAMTSALISTPIVAHGLEHGLAGTLSNTPLVGGGIAMIITIGAIIAALILLVVKVCVVALLAVLYVASPLAIALWPLEETSYLLRNLLGAISGLLAFPILWALCFGTFAVMPINSMFPGEHGHLVGTLLAPLVSLASLIIAFKLPFSVLGQALAHTGAGRSLIVVRQAAGRGGRRALTGMRGGS